MKRPKPCFLVLESYWSDELRSRNSVQPFIKGLCDLNGWEFFYRVFDSRNDLALWIDKFGRIRRSGKDKIIYLATHGSRSGRLWTLEQRIPLEALAKMLAGVPSLAALHLGSCSLGQPRILEKLLGGTALRWVAAYAEEVPWLESTALDLLFWSWIYSGAPRLKRFRRLTPETAAHELYEHYNVSEKMGFRVYYRNAETGDIRSSWETWQEAAQR
ncbi:MAG: hypothetical protein JW819_13790 [Candidatus Krumholzibacteriota bacterium]|nr:hypothetical protein [Candidatus Krumholzibacteriota bacterium]